VIHPPQSPHRALPELESSEVVTFADLVLAHFLRQRRLYEAADSDGYDVGFAEIAENAYQTRLKRFQAEHGTIERAYWCTYEISAVAITEQGVRLPWWRLRRTDTRRRMHAETDWATRDCPELAHQLLARPFVGAAFAVMTYLLLKSGLVDIGGPNLDKQAIYFYAAIGFLAGFSERWARVIVGGVIGDDESATSTQDAQRDNGRVTSTAMKESAATNPR